MDNNDTVRLPGSGPNPHWNIHRSLEELQGLQNAGLVLLQELDTHLKQRDSGGGQHPEALGTASAATIVVAYGVEIALKTLHAQIEPNKKPPRGHDLLDLFDALDDETKTKASGRLKTLPGVGPPEWVDQPDIRGMIEIGRANFTDWRYISDRSSVGAGVPKALINVMQALRAVALSGIEQS